MEKKILDVFVTSGDSFFTDGFEYSAEPHSSKVALESQWTLLQCQAGFIQTTDDHGIRFFFGNRLIHTRNFKFENPVRDFEVEIRRNLNRITRVFLDLKKIHAFEDFRQLFPHYLLCRHEDFVEKSSLFFNDVLNFLVSKNSNRDFYFVSDEFYISLDYFLFKLCAFYLEIFCCGGFGLYTFFELSEVMFLNQELIYGETKGKLVCLESTFLDIADFERSFFRLLLETQITFHDERPSGSGVFLGKFRIQIVGPPVSPTKQVNLRLFAETPIDLSLFLPSKNGDVTLNQGHQNIRTCNLEKFLVNAIETKKSILVCGGTSSGKTTLLNALLHLVPKEERVVMIEDTRELVVKTQSAWTALKTQNDGDVSGSSLEDLVKLSLRLRPDRLVVGEVRGSESWELIKSLNTGHEGSLCSIHANGALDALERLVNLSLEKSLIPHGELKKQIANAFEILIFVKCTKEKTSLLPNSPAVTSSAMTSSFVSSSLVSSKPETASHEGSRAICSILQRKRHADGSISWETIYESKRYVRDLTL